MRKFYIALLLFGLLTAISAPAQIVANDDTFNNLEGIAGDNSNLCFCLPPTILMNDTLNGTSVMGSPNVVTLTQLSTTHPNVNLVNTNNGYVAVSAGTPAGSYQITYQICEVANPSNCDTAVITVNVCNLPVPVVASITPSNCTNQASTVFLTNLPATGSWTLNDYDVFYGTGSGTSATITVNPGEHHLTVTSGQCTSPEITFTTGYLKPTLTGTYVDFNSDGVVNVGDKINYQISVKNISSCYLTNVLVSSSQMTIIGNAINMAAGVTNSSNFSASIVLTQADINTGFVDRTIRVLCDNANVVYPVFLTERTLLNTSNGIRLLAFYDNNGNGIKEEGEPYFTQGTFQYQINSGVQHHVIAYTGILPLYETNPANVYNLGFLTNGENCQYFCNASYPNVTVALNSGLVTYNFPVTVPPCVDLSVSLTNLTAPPRPGLSHVNYIYFTNLGNQTIASGTVVFTKDPAQNIVSVYPAGVATLTANGMSFPFINLAPNEIRLIAVTMHLPPIPGVSIGQPLTTTASITPNDSFPENNSASLTQMVVNSYDPNDKTENHGGTIIYDTFTSNDYLTYTIQFENTGNANALNVRLDDTLDAKLDETSIRMVNASHANILERVGNNLSWKFDNINLPPSVPNSTTGHGYVTFKVKPKPGYAVGDIIPNRANIYFDTNPAIVTNTVNTEFIAPLSVGDFAFTHFNCYPNPVKNTLNISNNSVIETVKIVSVLGQEIVCKKVNGLQTEMDLAGLSKGLYLVKISSEGQEKTVKIIKE